MNGLINSPIASLFKEPNKRSVLIDEVLYGTDIEIISEKLNFFYVNTFYNYQGYINKNEVSVVKSKLLFNGIITKHFVDVLEEPKYQSKIIITIPRGSYLEILPEKLNNGFQAVKLINNKKAYIKEDCFKYRVSYDLKIDEDTLRKNIVNNALLYLNTQYRWGGKTVLGIDCSGLCHISYLLEELIIYRDAIFEDEILTKYNLRKIAKEDLKLGDLIYLPEHILMYIGNNKYINSSGTTSGVTINSLNPLDNDYIESYDKNIIGYATIF